MNSRIATLTLIVAALCVTAAPDVIDRLGDRDLMSSAAAASQDTFDDDGRLASRITRRRHEDLEALKKHRPGFAFWRNVFTIADGAVAFGSGADGRPLVVFPASSSSDWSRSGRWFDASLAAVVAGRTLPRSVEERREYVATLLEQAIGGPVLHNYTRGSFAIPGLQRYGGILGEWAAIYERFGVPADVGLGQALLESGFEGTRRSEANAIGLCQWLKRNWDHLDRIDPTIIEAGNQTTQAAYCAAYLTVLATKYDSFLPALSEHHAGGTNIARIVMVGERLDGDEPRDQYLLGADFARDLRTIAHEQYSEIYKSYGPRSYRYAEMVFGNAPIITETIAATRQRPLYAMRTSKAWTPAEVARRSGLSADEVKRYNPALVKRVPAGATIYLPVYTKALGADVSFWHQPPTEQYTDLLNDFVRLDASPEEWDDASFEPTLRQFERRFRATGTEEGRVMATVLAYVIDESATSGRRRILAEYRSSTLVRALFEQGVRAREAIAETR